MSDVEHRHSDLRAIAPTVVHSLLGGDNAVVHRARHCKPPSTVAPFAAALLSAVLHGESIQASIGRVSQLFNLQFNEAWQVMGGDWCDELPTESSPCRGTRQGLRSPTTEMHLPTPSAR